MRHARHAVLALALAVAPLPGGARAKAAPPKAAPALPTCGPLPEMLAARPWPDAERLHYDVDVMGAFAGKLVLVAQPATGPDATEVEVRAMAASNTFFSKVRNIRGRAASQLDARTFLPRAYSEETREGPNERSAQVRFERSGRGKAMSLEYTRNGRNGKKRFSHDHDAFDPLSAFYALRGMKLAEGQTICFDAYGIRHHWRVSGKVRAKEVVKVPAGAFAAYHIEGRAYRVDDPARSREIHVWISADEQRLPLAAMGVMDLGLVRAQLTRIGGEADEDLQKAVASLGPNRPAAKAKSAAPRVR